MPDAAKWVIAIAAAVGLVWLGWHYNFVLVTLHILVCLLLIFVIMLQSGNAADLAGAFGGAGSQTAFGPRGAATFLTKATTWCAIVFMMSSLALSLKRAPTTAQGSSILEQTMPTAPSRPATPAQKPVPQAPVPKK
ncbi:MAG: preprotein translocase subunit SecG [Candidatus Acidiferrales bacterium]|jgi:preprotein translocase subunit SecG|nr:preprotein translocase subunit SecG [Candidatus Acidoferrales bacterium]